MPFVLNDVFIDLQTLWSEILSKFDVWLWSLMFDFIVLFWSRSLTLKLKFEFIEFLSESLKLTLKTTFAVDVYVWSRSLDLMFNAGLWRWHLMLTLNLMCKVGIWSWSLKSNFEVEVWGLKCEFEAWNWNLRLSIDSKSIHLNTEVEVWSAVFVAISSRSDNATNVT